MNTIVLQSFRTVDAPWWLSRCLDSVQRWCRGNGWAYEFLDDTFFSLAPQWVRQRCAGNLYALTDVCRLLWLQSKLREGYERVVWADADVLVFAPQNMRLEVEQKSAFAYELFLSVAPDGKPVAVEGISNAYMVFTRDDQALEIYLDACLHRLQQPSSKAIPRTALGPSMLVELDQASKLSTVPGIGLFTPPMMHELAGRGGPLIRDYARRFPSRLVAANLCHFMRNATPAPRRADFDRVYSAAVDHLLEAGSELFNE